MKIKRGKDWTDEGPSVHHSIYGFTHGGESIGRAKPVLTMGGLITQTKAHRIRKKKEAPEKKKSNWSRFQVKVRTKEQEERDRNGRPTA